MWLSFMRHPRPRRAFREWREYEDAVKQKDLVGALRFLKPLETEQRPFNKIPSSVSESTRSRFRKLEVMGLQRDWDFWTLLDNDRCPGESDIPAADGQ